MSPHLLDLVSLIKDIVTGIVAIGGLTVAALGLQAWRRQLRGRTQYDLARRTLRATYKVRNEIQSVRHPGISSGEFKVAREEAGIEENPQVVGSSIEDNVAVYQRRMNRLGEAWSDLELEITEAEVLWGKEISEAVKPLRSCTISLNASLRTYFRLMRAEERRRKVDRKRWEEADKIIYWTSDDPSEDSFTGSVSLAVEKVEEYLKPYLKI
ncbi:MAG: hypothetical protein AAFU51_13805 [Bacteroidota bacterium]